MSDYGDPGGPGGPAGGGHPPSPPPPPGGSGQPMVPGNPTPKGFFGALFDFGFTTFVTPMIVKVAYIVATVLIVLFWIGFLLVSLFSGEIAAFLLTLVLGSIGALFYLILIRMTLEFYLAVVRMSEDIHHRLR